MQWRSTVAVDVESFLLPCFPAIFSSRTFLIQHWTSCFNSPSHPYSAFSSYTFSTLSILSMWRYFLSASLELFTALKDACSNIFISVNSFFTPFSSLVSYSYFSDTLSCFVLLGCSMAAFKLSSAAYTFLFVCSFSPSSFSLCLVVCLSLESVFKCLVLPSCSFSQEWARKSSLATVQPGSSEGLFEAVLTSHLLSLLGNP